MLTFLLLLDTTNNNKESSITNFHGFRLELSFTNETENKKVFFFIMGRKMRSLHYLEASSVSMDDSQLSLIQHEMKTQKNKIHFLLYNISRE